MFVKYVGEYVDQIHICGIPSALRYLKEILFLYSPLTPQCFGWRGQSQEVNLKKMDIGLGTVARVCNIRHLGG